MKKYRYSLDLPITVEYQSVYCGDGDDMVEIINEALSEDYGFCVLNYSMKLEEIEKNIYDVYITNIEWDRSE